VDGLGRGGDNLMVQQHATTRAHAQL
jgi:hypothetical protein